MDGDFVFLEVELKRATQFFVEQRKYGIHGFNHRNFRAEHAEGDAKLKANVASSNHDNVLWEVFEGEGFSRGEHVVAERHERQFDWNRALCHDDVLCLNECCVFAFADFHRFSVLEDCPAADKFGTSVLEKRFNALVETVNDAFLPPNQVAHVKFSGSGNGDAHVAVFIGVFGEVMEGVSGVNQGFRRDATANEARAACTLSFDDDGLQTELC